MAQSVPERILAVLSLGPRDDDELASSIGVARQHINQAARSLEARGRLVREVGPAGKIVNRSPTSAEALPPRPGAANAPTRPTPALRPTVVRKSPARGARAEWFWEGNVQDRIAEHLAAEGWELVRIASTATRQRGDDIVARRDGRELVVEVKGYPSTGYADPRRASEVKATQPSLQAHHWLADALIHAMRILGTRANVSVAIGLPRVPRYERLLAEMDTPLRRLGLGILLVDEDGAVCFGIDPS